ncbi:MAG: hypothetical protein IPK78_04585 [Rhodospirillales bacterium]|nr:hypothetical protein [Rhodospirillales bacterium]
MDAEAELVIVHAAQQCPGDSQISLQANLRLLHHLAVDHCHGDRGEAARQQNENGQTGGNQLAGDRQSAKHSQHHRNP